MTHDRRYTSPAAFRRALTDRLNAAAKSTPWTPQQLQRQVAYDRLLEWLYLLDDHWIVKGATALLARNLGVRGTLDIDLYRQTTGDAAEADVWQAARADLGDWFTFEIGSGTPISNDATRLPVNALIGATTWIRFHLDLVGTAVQMTGQPEDVPPLARGPDPRRYPARLPCLPARRSHRRQGRRHLRALRHQSHALYPLPRSRRPGRDHHRRIDGRQRPTNRARI